MKETDSSLMLDKKILLNEFGVSGTQIIDGFIEEDYRTDLQGREGCITYDQMRKSDAQIFATLLACELPIRTTKWYIEAGSNLDGEIDDKSQKVVDFVKRNLFEELENTFDDLLREILTMLPFGFSVFEKVYGEDEGQIILKKLGFRKQTSIYKWQMDNGQPGIVQLSTNTDDATDAGKNNSNISIPKDKIVTFSFRKEGLNYEGTSILRSAYKHWYIKDKLYKFDAVRHERQSVGVPVIYLATGASEADKLEAKRIVRNIRSTEQTGIIMPGPKTDGRLFEFADTRGAGGTDLFESIKHHNREIAKNILAQFLELGDTRSGSRSLSEDQSDLFLLSLGSIAQQIADTINKEIIPALVDLNFDIGENYSYPKLEFEKLGNVDYKVLVDNIVALVGAGVITTDEGMEVYLRETLRLPIKEADKESKEDPKEEEKEIEEGNDIETRLKTLENQNKQKEIKASEHICDGGCNHNEDQVFNTKYFEELSNLIDKKFIIDINTENESK